MGAWEWPQRTIVALALIGTTIVAIRYDLIMLMCGGTMFGILYDFTRTQAQIKRKSWIFIGWTLFCAMANTALICLYQSNRSLMIELIIVTQLSDVYQYIIGKHLGKHYIGWISPRKTWEGYIGGLIVTLITLSWQYRVTNLVSMYLLGVTGGLISSVVKRHLGVKDYSQLLGHHGGWMDRADSLYLPGVVYWGL